jgi:hypothetical protein
MSHDHKPEDPRERRAPVPPPVDGVVPEAVIAPVEPFESERSLPTPTRTIRNGEIQGHPREMPGDRDSQ